MQLKKNTPVYATGDDKVGEIERVVIDPMTREVSHIVVEKGFLFPTARVVPLDAVFSATEERVDLRADADVDAFPELEEEHYVPMTAAAPTAAPSVEVPRPIVFFPPLGSWGAPGYIGAGYAQVVERNIPDGFLALEEGATVFDADGDKVGSIDEVITEAGGGRVTHFVVASGLLFKERRVIPGIWVKTILEGEVHLAVSGDVLFAARPYEG